ncbi:tetraacyldisaccharide 4'-kinase, partial [Oleiphilus sp. HI0061]
DVEVCVYDGQRALGNGYLLPMGPLRESQSRMKKLDFQVINGADDLPGVNSSEPYIRMDLRPGNLLPLKADPGQDGLNQALALDKLSGQP